MRLRRVHLLFVSLHSFLLSLIFLLSNKNIKDINKTRDMFLTSLVWGIEECQNIPCFIGFLYWSRFGVRIGGEKCFEFCPANSFHFFAVTIRPAHTFKLAIIKRSDNNECWWGSGASSTLTHYLVKFKVLLPMTQQVGLQGKLLKTHKQQTQRWCETCPRYLCLEIFCMSINNYQQW